MSIGRICSRTTYVVDLEESVRVAADRMKRENVGTLLVVDEHHAPVGILTDRDLAVRVVASGLDAGSTTVGEVMTAHPRTVSEEAPIEDAVMIMRSMAVRRLPVVDDGRRLVGIVSIDDVLELVTEELGNLGRIVACSHAGIGVPATIPARPGRVAPVVGLQRAVSDPKR